MINYCDLIELGFEREDSTDAVYTNTTGHQYYLLNKNYLFASLEYNIDEGTVTLWATDHNKKSHRGWDIDNLEDVIKMDEFLTKQEQFFNKKINFK